MANESKVRFPGVKDGETFLVGDIEFIKFPDMDGRTPVVTKNIQFRSTFGETNNLAESRVLKRLETEFLPKIMELVGEETLCTIRTDLACLDGLKPYPELESLVSLPTLDFYRANVEIFDKYDPKSWWLLATPDSAQPHCDPDWVLCVAPGGNLYYGDCGRGVRGVRPSLIFKSNIFGPCEE